MKTVRRWKGRGPLKHYYYTLPDLKGIICLCCCCPLLLSLPLLLLLLSSPPPHHHHQSRQHLAPAAADRVRALACMAVLGLARDASIRHILTKLQVSK